MQPVNSKHKFKKRVPTKASVLKRQEFAKQRQLLRYKEMAQKNQEAYRRCMKMWPTPLHRKHVLVTLRGQSKKKQRKSASHSARIAFLGQTFLATTPFKEVLLQTYGIGKRFQPQICIELNIMQNTPLGSFSKRQLMDAEQYIVTSLEPTSLGAQLRKVQGEHLRTLAKLGLVRGVRLRKGLPVRGQRTRTNAKSARRSVARRLMFRQK